MVILVFFYTMTYLFVACGFPSFLFSIGTVTEEQVTVAKSTFNIVLTLGKQLSFEGHVLQVQAKSIHNVTGVSEGNVKQALLALKRLGFIITFDTQRAQGSWIVLAPPGLRHIFQLLIL
jgi:hypothetical protein